MKKITVLFLLVCMVFFTACSGNKHVSTNTTVKPSDNTAETTTLTSTMAASSTTAVTLITTSKTATKTTVVNGKTTTKAQITTTKKSNELIVLFLGNSLTFSGNIPQKFELLAKNRSKEVVILEKTNPGYKLSQHYDDLKTGELNDVFVKDVDVVILQEFGSSGIGTASAVANIKKLFAPTVKFYFLLTEMDIPKRTEELKGVGGLTYIPSGEAHNLLLSDGFTYEQLHLENDFHPNGLYGYVSALTVYSVLYGESCVGIPCPADQLNILPGSTTSEKNKINAKIEAKVMQAIQKYK
ncbi:MAG: hypothetical protein BGN88_07475 [Clostridiales bacterium 43-6]|nr:MAG: hypothetical protein BGN88_07475 [Clostridiales bacterium 43-6]